MPSLPPNIKILSILAKHCWKNCFPMKTRVVSNNLSLVVAWQVNWFPSETVNCFLLTLLKFLLFYLQWNKVVIIQMLVTFKLYNFLRNYTYGCNWQKKHQIEKWVKGSWEWNPTWVNHNTEKTVMFNSSCRILSFQYTRACTSKANLHLIQGKSERKQKYLCATFTLVYT